MLSKIEIKYFNGIETICAIGKHNCEIIYTKNPKIIIIPKNGPASRFEIQNVNETVLKLNAITGVIIKFAHTETHIELKIYCLIFP